MIRLWPKKQAQKLKRHKKMLNYDSVYEKYHFNNLVLAVLDFIARIQHITL